MVECQCIKLEIWVSNPTLDTNFSLNIYQNYTASHVLCVATDDCRLRPWLACRLTSMASYWRFSQTLTLLFQFSFWVDGHVHLQSRDVSIYWLWLLLDVSLSPNCTEIRHRSSWKLYSKFASYFRTRLSAFHICIVNIHTFTKWEFLSRHVTNHNHYTYSTNV